MGEPQLSDMSDDRARFVDLGPWPTFDTTGGLCRLPENAHVDFFADNSAKARALCLRCPLKTACAEYAIPIPALHGVWGGTTQESRKRARVERGLNDRKPTLSVSQTTRGWYATIKGIGRSRAAGDMPLVSSGTTKLRALRNLAKKAMGLDDHEYLLELIADELAEGQVLETDGYDWGVKQRYVQKKYGKALWEPRVPSGYSPPTKATITPKLGSML